MNQGRAKKRRKSAYMTITEQLARLRQTVATIDRKYAHLPPPPVPQPEPATAWFVEELLTGAVVETPLGRHFETEKLYARHQRYGSYDISDLIDLPPDLLDSLSAGAIPSAAPTSSASASSSCVTTARKRRCCTL
jgi:hypothetical protein